jgi:fluoride exporter
METLAKYLAVAAGGALGALLRYILNHSFLAALFPPFPFPTFFINVTGSFAIGLIFAVTTEKFFISETTRLFLTVGFLGAYTTFSTFEFETLELAGAKYYWQAAMYAILSFGVGFLAVIAGVWLGKRF